MVSNRRMLLYWLIVILTISGTAVAQKKANERPDRSTLPVSGFELHGGFVNYVDGNGRCLCVQPANDKAKQPLTNGDAMELDDGRAEAVLIPGYYLRLSNHSTARLLDLSRDNLKIEITKGSAIIEIPMEDSFQLPAQIQEIKDRLFNTVTVITPGGEYSIFKPGGYRFDVVSSRESRVKVLKGAIAAGGHILKNGDAAQVVAGVVGVEFAEKYADDAFDKWSRSRAAALVASNKSLKHSEWYKRMTDGGYLDIRDDADKSDGGNAHVVSALNGIAGFVEPGVAVKSHDTDWRELKSDSQLSDGDRLRTALHSRAEIRPYPDFDLYLNGNTETVYKTDADGNVSIDVVRGSVVLLVSQSRVKRAERNTLKLSANNTEYAITSTGYYRLNVFSPDQSEMLVYSGSSVSAEGEMGGGKRIVARGQSRIASSFDKDARDSFDIWSDRRNARSQFASVRRRWWYAGLWFFNAETGEYTFVPGERVCKSPYGGLYSTMYLMNRSGIRSRPPLRPLFNP